MVAGGYADGLLATKIAGLSYIRFLNGYNEWFESSVDGSITVQIS